MTTLQRPPLAMVGLLAVLLGPNVSALAEVPPAVQLTPTLIEPVVLTQGAELLGCGVRVAALLPATSDSATSQPSLRFELTNRIKAGATEFVLAGFIDIADLDPANLATAHPKPSAALTDVAIRSQQPDADQAFAPSTRLDVGGVERRATLPGFQGGLFMQSLMVGGGTFMATFNQAPVELQVAGPLPNSIRALYLNCAGDLYRPTE